MSCPSSSLGGPEVAPLHAAHSPQSPVLSVYDDRDLALDHLFRSSCSNSEFSRFDISEKSLCDPPSQDSESEAFHTRLANRKSFHLQVDFSISSGRGLFGPFVFTSGTPPRARPELVTLRPFIIHPPTPCVLRARSPSFDEQSTPSNPVFDDDFDGDGFSQWSQTEDGKDEDWFAVEDMVYDVVADLAFEVNDGVNVDLFRPLWPSLKV